MAVAFSGGLFPEEPVELDHLRIEIRNQRSADGRFARAAGAADPDQRDGRGTVIPGLLDEERFLPEPVGLGYLCPGRPVNSVVILADQAVVFPRSSEQPPDMVLGLSHPLYEVEVRHVDVEETVFDTATVDRVEEPGVLLEGLRNREPVYTGRDLGEALAVDRAPLEELELQPVRPENFVQYVQ